MALTQPAVAQVIARDLAAQVHAEPCVRRLWVWSSHGEVEPGRDYVEFWLYLDTDDDDTVQRTREIVASLHEVFPDVNMMAFLMTPKVLDGHAPEEVMRTDVEEVPLGRQ